MHKLEFTKGSMRLFIETENRDLFLASLEMVSEFLELDDSEIDDVTIIDDAPVTNDNISIFDIEAEDEDIEDNFIAIDDNFIASDDADFNIPRYVEIADEENLEFWNDFLEEIKAHPTDEFFNRYPDIPDDGFFEDLDELLKDDIFIDDALEDEFFTEDEDDAEEIPVVRDDIPQELPDVQLLANLHVECSKCGEITEVNPLSSTFACQHCDIPQFTTRDRDIRNHHCPKCDKMIRIAVTRSDLPKMFAVKCEGCGKTVIVMSNGGRLESF